MFFHVFILLLAVNTLHFFLKKIWQRGALVSISASAGKPAGAGVGISGYFERLEEAVGKSVSNCTFALNLIVQIRLNLKCSIALLACLIVWAAVFFPACSERKERIIREKIAERVAEFRKKNSADCRAQLLEDAEKIADSLLLYEALSEVNDSLKRTRPFRPLPPGQIAPLDSGAVKPIFDQ